MTKTKTKTKTTNEDSKVLAHAGVTPRAVADEDAPPKPKSRKERTALILAHYAATKKHLESEIQRMADTLEPVTDETYKYIGFGPFGFASTGLRVVTLRMMLRDVVREMNELQSGDYQL